MKKILLAYDGSPAAERALHTTAELATLSGSAVTLLGVLSPISPGSERYPASVPDDLGWALERARGVLSARGIEATTAEYEGDPAATIEWLADEEGFDTIVVGSRARGWLRRMLDGSVSGHVATHARETVVVAR